MKRIAILAAGLSLMVPGAAGASSSSTCQAYNPQLCVVSSGTTQGSASGTRQSSAESSASSGTLPFTGLDVVLLAAGGGTLVGAGFVVRRASHRLN
jgi:hypothetical protein